MSAGSIVFRGKPLVKIQILLKAALVAAVLWTGASIKVLANGISNPEIRPLVDAAWIKTNAKKPGIRMLDIRIGAQKSYENGHIPGSVYTDYLKNRWRVKNAAGVPGMLPNIKSLETVIGTLGIDNTTHVVLIPAGDDALEMGGATRLYWIFKLLGHDKVSILNGGLKAYVKAGYDMDWDIETPDHKTFNAQFRPELLATKADVVAARKQGIPLVDNRPIQEFRGMWKNPQITEPGTIKGAHHVPATKITIKNGGYFQNRAALKKLYQKAGVKTDGAQIVFCNTGHWASIGWFVASEILGNKSVRLYDGSLAEWSRDKTRTVIRGARP
jgi:thiosulfate/3-mercaptopyruvate sulfurtransferase